MALKRLQFELKEINKDPNYFYSVEPEKNNIYKWGIIMIGTPDTIFEGMIIKANIEFTKDYPNKAPIFYFTSPMFHPNIYSDGKMCISILHEGVDEFGYESISERWSPSQSVNSILISILSILGDPNFESPANVDACKLWKENFNEYKKIIYRMVASSQ